MPIDFQFPAGTLPEPEEPPKISGGAKVVAVVLVTAAMAFILLCLTAASYAIVNAAFG